jgi:ABC-2 type transport system permease protein
MMKIIDIALKDLVRSIRNFFLVGMAFAAPLLLTGLIYFAFGSLLSGNVSQLEVKVGVVNLDKLPADSPLEAPIGKNIRDMFFDDSVKSWITASDYPDETAARSAVDNQEIGAAIIIPAGFSEKILAGQTDMPIILLQDPTLSIGPGVVKEMLTSVIDGVVGGGVAYQVINARQQANGRELDPASYPTVLEKYSTWYVDFQRALFHNPEKATLVISSPTTSNDSLQDMMGSVMAGQLIFFSFFTGAYAMMTILQEDEEGTLSRLFTTPTRRTAILAGKFLYVFLIVLLQGLVLTTIAHFLFNIDWGQPASVALSLLGQMVAAVGLAALLVSFLKSSKQAGFVFGGVLTAMGMLSGLFTTNIAMPASFAALAKFTPQGWALKAWELSLGGLPPSQLLLPFFVLVGMGVVMFAIGATLFRRRYA